MAAKKNSGTRKHDDNTIVTNRKARHDYFIEEQYEAGLVLEGWEVKSLRQNRAQLKESYVTVRNNEIHLIGAHFSPLPATATHTNPNPLRTRKLLLNRKEISTLRGAIERRGYTLIPLSLYWNKGYAKLKIALARGKKQHDKREATKKRDWEREQHRILKPRV